MKNSFIEESQQRSTIAKLVQWLHKKEVKPNQVICVGQSAVDKEFEIIAGLSTSARFPEGEILGYKVRVVPDFYVVSKATNPSGMPSEERVFDGESWQEKDKQRG